MEDQIKVLEAQVAALTGEISDATAALEAAQKENADLKTKLETAADAVAESPSAITSKKFKSGGNSYGFNAAAFRINGKKVTADEALKDQKLLDLIVKDFPGLVKKV